MCKDTLKIVRDMQLQQAKNEEKSLARDMLINEKLKNFNETRGFLVKELRAGFDGIKEDVKLIHKKLDTQDEKIQKNTSYINKALGVVGAITLVGWVGLKSLFTS